MDDSEHRMCQQSDETVKYLSKSIYQWWSVQVNCVIPEHSEKKKLLSWFSGTTPTDRRSNQTITLPAASIHPIMGLLFISLQMTLVEADIPSYHKLPLLTKQEMLTHFSYLVFTEHACTAARIRCWNTYFCFRRSTIFKILTSTFIWECFQEYWCKSKNFPKLCKPKVNDIRNHSKKQMNFKIFRQRCARPM
jgi:hypothetical protein